MVKREILLHLKLFIEIKEILIIFSPEIYNHEKNYYNHFRACLIGKL